MRSLHVRAKQQIQPDMFGASFEADLLKADLNPLITYARASTKYYFDATGTLQAAAPNVWPVEYDPVSLKALGRSAWGVRANWIRNPRAEGAVAGTPGSNPTYWSLGVVPGLTKVIVGTGVESGLPYIDVRWYGTPTTSGNNTISLEVNNTSGIVASAGQAWTYSVYARLVAGSMPAKMSVSCLEMDSTPTQIGTLGGNVQVTPTSAPLVSQRFSVSATTPANTAYLFPWLIVPVTSGVAVDVTIRFACPQLEQGPDVTSIILPPAGSPAVTTRGGDIIYVPAGPWLGNGMAGTLYAEYLVNNRTIGVGSYYVAALGSASGNGRYSIRSDSGGSANVASVSQTSDGQTTEIFSLGPMNYGTINRACISWSERDQSGALNNALTQGQGAISAGQMNNGMAIGGYIVNGISSLNGFVRKVRFWPRALSREIVQGITYLTGDDAIVDLDMTQATLDTRLVISRASAKSYFDATGTRQDAPANSSPPEYDPVTLAPLGVSSWPAATNGVRNPRGEGAAAGTPGTNPTYWGGAGSIGLTRTLIGSGVEQGLPYVDFRYFGTSTATSFALMAFEGSAGIAATPGQVWTMSYFTKLVGGTLNGVQGISANFLAMDSTPAQVGAAPSSAIQLTTNPLPANRQSATLTTPANTASVYPRIILNVANGAAIDFTIRLSCPQVELGSTPTPIILPPAGSPAASTRAVESQILAAGGVYNPAALSLACEYMTPVVIGLGRVLELNDGTSNNAVAFVENTPAAVQSSMTVAGANQGDVTLTTGAAAGAFHKVAGSYAGSTRMSCIDGSAPVTGANAMPASVSNLTLGASVINNRMLSGYIRRARMWQRALPATELQDITR